MNVIEDKELFKEYFNDHWKVLDELRSCMMSGEDSINGTAADINITPPTLTRLLQNGHHMNFSTWCKIKKFVTSIDKKG